jgi:hypothetical protein
LPYKTRRCRCIDQIKGIETLSSMWCRTTKCYHHSNNSNSRCSFGSSRIFHSTCSSSCTGRLGRYSNKNLAGPGENEWPHGRSQFRFIHRHQPHHMKVMHSGDRCCKLIRCSDSRRPLQYRDLLWIRCKHPLSQLQTPNSLK